MRILVVEDSVTMRRVMEMTFAGEDAELLAVESGELALQQGKDFAPDVAFIDASLPGLDGYEVTRRIKADPQLGATAVVLMASQHRPLDEARASEVGADDHILKPFDTQEAIDKATTLAGPSRGALRRPVDSRRAPSDDAATAGVAAVAPTDPSAAPGRRPIGAAHGAHPCQDTPLTGAPVAATSSAAVSSIPPASPVPQSNAPISSAPVPAQKPAVMSQAISGSVVERLETLGLTPEQVEGVLKLSAEVVERVVWEVVPDLAEAMIREELHRLVGD